MSVQALSCAFAVRGLSASEKLVLLALANFANDGMQCWPSQERLAADTELSPRTVWGALKSLGDKGVISRAARKRADGTRTTDVFTLHFALQVWSEPVANSANSTRNDCEAGSQDLREPVAPVARLTTFEPSPEEPSVEPSPCAKGRAPGVSLIEFERFWKAYPRKTAKDTARKAFPRALNKVPIETMIAALERQRGWEQWRRGVVPHAATWLNQARWADDDPEPQAPDERSHDDPKLINRQANNARSFAGAAEAARQRWKP